MIAAEKERVESYSPAGPWILPTAFEPLQSALDRSLTSEDFDEAEALCRLMLTLAPQNLQIRRQLAAIVSRCERADEAIDLLRTILEQDPAQPQIRAQLARLQLQRHVSSAMRATKGQPGRVWFRLGCLLQQRGRWQNACDCFQQALETGGDEDECHRALAETLLRLDEPEEALHHCGLLADRKKATPEVQCLAGLAMLEIGRTAEARKFLDEAVHAAPDDARLRWNRTLIHLALGEWEQAWPEFELRWHQGALPWQPATPRWRGEKIDGVLLLQADWGLGDTLQMLRYLPVLRDRCQRLVLACPTVLHPLLDQSPWIDALVAPDQLPDFAAAAPLLSLPGIFGTTLDNIPVPFNDFAVAPSRPAFETLSQNQGISVGFVWAGRADHGNDLLRSIPLEFLLALFRVDHASFFSLQKGAAQGDLDAFIARHPKIGIKLVSLAPELSSLTDTAAAVASLDLVICVDTMIAHLAGSLGKPTWLLLPYAADWRWLAAGSFDGRYDELTPWYPSMRLFRQSRRGDWPETVERVAAALRRLIADRK